MSKNLNRKQKKLQSENINPTLTGFRKQTRFSTGKNIIGRNDLNHCVVCGVSFKKGGVTHKVVKSAKGLRLHLCGECAGDHYPNAKPYVKAVRHKLTGGV